ncbi:MAG: helix-turn-helix domain-containing protein [Nitrospirae bacterium]|nr:helix-turn-helix domain-containing protein [Nitrospirota bacterium]
MQIPYYSIIKDMKTKFDFRYHLVQYAKSHSVSQAAREFSTTRKTVRKWISRFEKLALRGLNDRSKAPHHIPHKTKELDENRIHLAREKYPQWGPKRLRDLAKLPYGSSAIYRVLKARGLCHKKKKYQKKRDLREWKKKHFSVFGKIQIDVKYLKDIPEFFPSMIRLNLPRFEYTGRCIISGATFVAYANANNSTHAAIFAQYLFQHLRYYNVDTSTIQCQYDNGSEFIGHPSKKELSLFQKQVDSFRLLHSRIPPARPTFNSDVESFHRIVEQELYSCESFENQSQFFAKAYSYSLFYNYVRPNSGKENLAPWQIVKKAFPDIDPNVLNLQPIFLDALVTHFIEGGYHLPKFPIGQKNFGQKNQFFSKRNSLGGGMAISCRLQGYAVYPADLSVNNPPG